MLENRRLASLVALLLLSAAALLFVAVGRRSPSAAPDTTLAFVGRLDASASREMDGFRNAAFTGIALALSLVGRSMATVPLRALVAVWLGWRRRWVGLATWLLTWAAVETAVSVGKAFFQRGRPPEPLVSTGGYSLPSGHAAAGAAIAVALVLVLLPLGSRRGWWAAALAFAVAMALSRVYLHAHWLSDVLAGALLGGGIALGSAAIVDGFSPAERVSPPEPPSGPRPDRRR